MCQCASVSVCVRECVWLCAYVCVCMRACVACLRAWRWADHLAPEFVRVCVRGAVILT